MGFWPQAVLQRRFSMNKHKITWDKVYEDFRLHHPKLEKKVLGYYPHDFATILLIFPDQVRMTYNYDTKELLKTKQKEEKQ